MMFGLQTLDLVRIQGYFFVCSMQRLHMSVFTAVAASAASSSTAMPICFVPVIRCLSICTGKRQVGEEHE